MTGRYIYIHASTEVRERFRLAQKKRDRLYLYKEHQLRMSPETPVTVRSVKERACVGNFAGSAVQTLKVAGSNPAKACMYVHIATRHDNMKYVISSRSVWP